MKWVPKWLGEAYARLYQSYGTSVFTLEDVKEIAGEKRALLILSKLRRASFLSIFRKSKKKYYRLAPPDALMVWLSLSGEPFSLGPYQNLAMEILRELNFFYGKKLTSVIAFGSVARKSATPTSDFDCMVVSEWERSYFSRIDELSEIEHSCLRRELGWLEKNGISTHISWFPFTREEAILPRPLYFDFLEDSVIIFDRERFFRSFLDELREKLKKKGALRIWLDKDRWYWILHPSLEREKAAEL
jgi:hypothetical protein